MKKWALLLFAISFEAMALEAVVTVLETPLLKSKSYDAPVVQYLRKGDVIKIHPSVANKREFERFAPSPKKEKEIRKKLQEAPDYHKDPLFPDNENRTAYLEDEFIPTLDRQGHTVYVIASHIYVYFNDAREFDQRITSHDPTDYRLEEPLPKNYPLKSPTGYRGQFIIGLTQPTFESYDYPDKIKTKGYSTPYDLQYTLMRQAPGNYHDRLFIGGTIGFRYSENSFTFHDRRMSLERSIRLGLGPTISYDAFKGEKNRVNLSGTILVNLFDRFYIDQTLDSHEENREYLGYSVVPRISIQYHRKAITEDLDFVLGTALEMALPTTYRAKDPGRNTTWWQHIGNDQFTTRTSFALGGYIGLQSAY